MILTFIPVAKIDRKIYLHKCILNNNLRFLEETCFLRTSNKNVKGKVAAISHYPYSKEWGPSASKYFYSMTQSSKSMVYSLKLVQEPHTGLQWDKYRNGDCLEVLRAIWEKDYASLEASKMIVFGMYFFLSFLSIVFHKMFVYNWSWLVPDLPQRQLKKHCC